MFEPATGERLDNIAALYGFERKKYFWFIKESDAELRKRILKFLRKR